MQSHVGVIVDDENMHESLVKLCTSSCKGVDCCGECDGTDERNVYTLLELLYGSDSVVRMLLLEGIGAEKEPGVKKEENASVVKTEEEEDDDQERFVGGYEAGAVRNYGAIVDVD